MIIIRDGTHIKGIFLARATVKPRQDGNVSVLGTVYRADDVLELTDEYRVQEIRDAEKRVLATEKQRDALMFEIFRQYKRLGIS